MAQVQATTWSFPSMIWIPGKSSAQTNPTITATDNVESSPLNTTDQLASDLARDGYAARLSSTYSEGFEQIANGLKPAFNKLPPDPYSLSSGRYRQYSRMVYMPWSGSFEWLPEAQIDGLECSPYDQGSFNSEHQLVRYLPSLPQEVKLDSEFRDLLLKDVSSLRELEAFRIWPVYLGIHLIRLLVKPGELEAVTTPNSMHQDGGTDMYTFVHLVNLENASGGNTLVGDTRCAGLSPERVDEADIRASLRLERPGDLYVVDDQAVSHHASGIRAIDPEAPAVRDIILVGVSPYKPTFF
jgi:hypothetical protein